ncbi:hypothetical protein D9V30_00160 [Mycetocola reblochoni]|uniref:Uncharacterized protein n=1 Tax=Mycetocola reblochoni TaxID=331618 RepID=A0A3L6ZTB4_9MICO|nr:hypothetical protein [Mycetocola reblochoni]RLP70885.1 hypothetical protein D9V30_00160 [Mycetocola reblochoni]
MTENIDHKPFTLDDLQEDLSLANELAEEFAYGRDEAGLLVEQYRLPEASLVARYRLDATIKAVEA